MNKLTNKLKIKTEGGEGRGVSWQVVVGLHLSVNYRLNPAFLSQIDLIAVHDKESASNGSQWELWD